MRIAGILQDSIVDGPGLRCVVFTQGCPHHCPGCHNPESLDITGGTETPVSSIIETLYQNPLSDGLTLSGGEPFLQAADCVSLAKAAKKANLNVWCYTGYTLETLQEMAKKNPDISALLTEIDVLVDGPFLLKERSLSLRFRGSRNQRVIDMAKTRESGKITLLSGF